MCGDAQTSKKYGSYVISWMKRSTYYYAVELPLRLKAYGRNGDISAISSEAAQAAGRKFVHECKALVATGGHHRCAIKRHLAATSAGRTLEQLTKARNDARKRLRDRIPAMHAIWATALAALEFEFPADFVSVWNSLDNNANDVGGDLGEAEDARDATSLQGDVTGEASRASEENFLPGDDDEDGAEDDGDDDL